MAFWWVIVFVKKHTFPLITGRVWPIGHYSGPQMIVSNKTRLWHFPMGA